MIRWVAVVLATLMVVSAPADAAKRRAKRAPAGLEAPRARVARDLGIEDVDREHRELCAAMNALMKRACGEEDTMSLALGVRELLDALTRHFATEERHMTSQPGLWDDAHRREHRRLLRDIRLITSVVNDQSVMLAIRFLGQWLVRHAQSHDSMLVAANASRSRRRRARRAAG